MKGIIVLLLVIISTLLFLIFKEVQGIHYRVRTIEYNTPTLRHNLLK